MTTSTSTTSKLTAAAIAVGGQMVVLTNSAHAIANQPPYPPMPDVAGLANINGHLQTAQSHANAWLNTYSAEVLSTLQGVVTFGELYTNLYGSLLGAAQGLGTQTAFNQGQIASLIAQIGALQGSVKNQSAAAAAVYADIANYSSAVSDDVSTFGGDYNAATEALKGDSGQIAQLQAQVASYNQALSSANVMMGGGGAGMLIGGLVAVVGLLAEIPTAGASTALVVGGVAMAVSGSVVFGMGSNDQDNDLEGLHNAMTQLATDNAEVAALTHLQTSFSGIETQLNSAQTALSTVMTSWQELDNGLVAIVADLGQPEQYLSTLKQSDPSATPATVSAIVCAELQTANEDWASSLATAKTLLSNLSNTQLLSTQGLPTTQNISAAYAASAS